MCATYGEQIGHSSIVRLEHGAKFAEDQKHQGQKKEYTIAKHLSDRLERAISDLPQTERVILEERYINRDKGPWAHIAQIVGYAESGCYKLHNRGLRSVAIHLFGLAEVLRAEEEKRARRRIV